MTDRLNLDRIKEKNDPPGFHIDQADVKNMVDEIDRLRFFNEGIGKEIDQLRVENEHLKNDNPELKNCQALATARKVHIEGLKYDAMMKDLEIARLRRIEDAIIGPSPSGIRNSEEWSEHLMNVCRANPRPKETTP